MSLFIKGMDKPDDCVSCDFRRDDKCMAMGGKSLSEFAEDETFLMFGWIPSCCPLVEVSVPHGELHDETKITRFALDMKISHSDYATWWYGEEPVIEAEG